eukprot:8609709-Pyramimonas_sp.AAC.1
MRSKGCSFAQKKIIRKVFCRAYTTAASLNRWGYEVTPFCKFCEAIDSVWHRIWICPHGASARIALDQDLLEEALTAGEQDP